MQWLEVAVTTTAEAVEAVGAQFAALGSGGLVVEDLPAPGARRVVAYWPAGQEAEERLASLRRFLRALPAFGLDPGPAEVRVILRDEAEWAESWKRHYRLQRIGKLVIRPSWEAYAPAPGEVVIDLDPGMAFGTGTHPTTALCLAALQEEASRSGTAVDAGTGSGILAIAAAKLGAGRVVACDVDPLACRVAEENVRRNGVSDRVEVRCGDAREVLRSLGRRVDLLLANIVAEVIADLAPDFAAAAVPGGRLLASGITAERSAEVAQALEASALFVTGVRERDGWVVLRAVRR